MRVLGLAIKDSMLKGGRTPIDPNERVNLDGCCSQRGQAQKTWFKSSDS